MAIERRSEVVARLEAVLQAAPLSLRAGRFAELASAGMWQIGRIEAVHGGPRGRVYVLEQSGDRVESDRSGSVRRVDEHLDVVVSELHDGRVRRVEQKLALLAFGETVTRELFDDLGDSWWPGATVTVRDAATADGYELIVPGRISYLRELEV